MANRFTVFDKRYRNVIGTIDASNIGQATMLIANGAFGKKTAGGYCIAQFVHDRGRDFVVVDAGGKCEHRSAAQAHMEEFWKRA